MPPTNLIVLTPSPVPFGLLVWSTGLAPNPLIQSMEGYKKDNRTGRSDSPTNSLKPRAHTTSSVITNPNLNILNEKGFSNPDVWAIGDAATIEDQPLPATAQGTISLHPLLASVILHLTRTFRVDSGEPKRSLRS